MPRTIRKRPAHDAWTSAWTVCLSLALLVAPAFALPADCGPSPIALDDCCCGCEAPAPGHGVEAPSCGCHVEPLPPAPTSPRDAEFIVGFPVTLGEPGPAGVGRDTPARGPLASFPPTGVPSWARARTCVRLL